MDIHASYGLSAIARSGHTARQHCHQHGPSEDKERALDKDEESPGARLNFYYLFYGSAGRVMKNHLENLNKILNKV